MHRHRAGLTPAITAGKGWRGRRELAPRCSATQLGACIVGAYGEPHTSYTRSEPPPPPPHTHTTPPPPSPGVSLKPVDLLVKLSCYPDDGWRTRQRRCPAPKGAPPTRMATACAYGGAAGSRGEASPQREQGGAGQRRTGTGEESWQGGGRARDALWPTGTDAPASGEAAGAS